MVAFSKKRSGRFFSVWLFFTRPQMSKRKLTECPICWEDNHSFATIWNCCSKGHSWCGECNIALRNSQCPVCKLAIDVNPSKRSENIVVKQLVGMETITCEYCDQTMTKESYEDHKVACVEEKVFGFLETYETSEQLRLKLLQLASTCARIKKRGVAHVCV